jgi:lysozyme
MVRRPFRGRRRWWTAIVLGVLVVLGLVAALGWLPGYRPALRPGERYGIDVASYQGRVNWPAVSRDGIRFAYIKATEG